MSEVSHPPHYGGDTPYEAIKVLEAWLTPTEFIGWCKGNSLTYLARHRHKGGLLDLEKALWYDGYLVRYLKEQGLDGKNEVDPFAPIEKVPTYIVIMPDGRHEEFTSLEEATLKHAMTHKLHPEPTPKPFEPIDTAIVTRAGRRMIRKANDDMVKNSKKRDSRGYLIGKRAFRAKH
jgi:hypothetical protein